MTRGTGRARTATALAAVAVCGALTVAGCGSSGDSGGAPATTSPPVTSAPVTTATPTTAASTPVAPVGPGDAAAGKAVFAASCDTCHAGLGTRKYVGPKLAGLGLSPAFIRNRVIQGKSPMPAGLVQGQDLADVVAFVHSIQ